MVQSDNVKSLKMMRQLGAVGEGLCRHTFGEHVDAVVFGMLKEECKWL